MSENIVIASIIFVTELKWRLRSLYILRVPMRRRTGQGLSDDKREIEQSNVVVKKHAHFLIQRSVCNYHVSLTLMLN